MAEAGGAFVTRAFERMLKDSSGRKYGTLQTALKAYLGEVFLAIQCVVVRLCEDALTSEPVLVLRESVGFSGELL